MKFILFLTLITANNYCFGQTIKLFIDYPGLRVGEEVELKYQIDQKDSAANRWTGNFDNSLDGTIKLAGTMTKVGMNRIGPLTLRFNETDYKSNELSIHIDSALPNVVNGIWVRHIQYDNQEYLVVEQRTTATAKAKQNGNSISSEYSTRNGDFIELIESSFPNTLKVDFTSSYSRNQQIAASGNNKGGFPYYKRWVYQLTKKEGYKGDYTVSARNFKNFPGGNKLAVLIR